MARIEEAGPPTITTGGGMVRIRLGEKTEIMLPAVDALLLALDIARAAEAELASPAPTAS